MTIVQVEDTRNVEWRANNKGSALLQKMGWTEGKGIGKRNFNATALRAVKRQEGLGLGAKLETEGGQSESTSTFAAVLKNLQQHHGSSNDGGSKAEKKEKVKKKKTRGLVLPQNKVTAGHAQKMRLAKFREKSEDDLACIFGNKDVSMTFSQPVVAAMAAPIMVETSTDVCNVKVKARKSKKDKKNKKKRCLETVQDECPSANEDSNKVSKKAKRKMAS